MSHLSNSKAAGEVVLFPIAYNVVTELIASGFFVAACIFLYFVGKALWAADSKAIKEEQQHRDRKDAAVAEESAKKTDTNTKPSVVEKETADTAAPLSKTAERKRRMGQSASAGAGAAATAGAATSFSSEKMVMALFVRQDLKMGTGKSAAQCAHAAVASTEQCMESVGNTKGLLWFDWLEVWRKECGSNTVVFKAPSEDELKSLAASAKAAKLPHYLVRDAGRTQIAAGSRTVTAIGPAPESIIMPLAAGFNKL